MEWPQGYWHEQGLDEPPTERIERYQKFWSSQMPGVLKDDTEIQNFLFTYNGNEFGADWDYLLAYGRAHGFIEGNILLGKAWIEIEGLFTKVRDSSKIIPVSTMEGFVLTGGSGLTGINIPLVQLFRRSGFCERIMHCLILYPAPISEVWRGPSISATVTEESDYKLQRRHFQSTGQWASERALKSLQLEVLPNVEV